MSLRSCCLRLLVLTSCACTDQGEPTPLEPLATETYAQQVQPFVGASCATLDCHGDRGRPLRLYSELGLRRSDALRARALDEERAPERLTDQELKDNVLAFAALEPVDADGERLALSKPLAQSAGGAAHEGGDLFASTNAPGYRCLRQWLLGASADAGASSCAQALDAIPLRP